MDSILFILAVVSSMLLFVNSVFLIKKIKNEKDIAFNTIGGAVLDITYLKDNTRNSNIRSTRIEESCGFE